MKLREYSEFLRKRLAALALISFALLFNEGCVAERVIRVSDGQPVPTAELFRQAEAARIIFIGEQHDKMWNHRVQLDVIKALFEAGADLSVGMEMFKATAQPTLDSWVSGEMPVRDFVRFYYESWSMPWPLYRDILNYVRENHIPLVGLNVSNEIIHRVFTRGFSSLTSEELTLLPGARCDVDSTYEEFIRRAMGGHDLSEKGFKNFCEAQMVWDTTMAYQAVEYLERHPGRKMVIISGSGHSWKRGIPAQVGRLSDITYVVILPEVPGKLDRSNMTTEDADYLWLEP